MSKKNMRRALFHGLRATARLVALGGTRALARYGSAFGALHFWLGVRSRRQLLKQMARLMPQRAAQGQLPGDLLEAYRVNDRAIIEILAAYSGSLRPNQSAGICELENPEVLDRALAQGDGLILLGMHMGNGVAMAITLATLGYPVSVVYRESNKITPAFFRDGIQRQGLEAIAAKPPAAGFRAMMRALRCKRIVFILMDQASKQGGVPTHFLGKKLDMPPGPAELGRRAGAPIVPALLTGVDARWRFRFEEPILLDRSRPLAEEVKMLTDVLEAHILQHPQWWTWHQRRWRRYPFLPDSPTGPAP